MPAGEFDVELVTTIPIGAAPRGWAPKSLRDWGMMGYGAVFAAIVSLLIWLIASAI